MTKQFNARLPQHTLVQIDALAERLGMTKTQVLILAVDRLSREELEMYYIVVHYADDPDDVNKGGIPEAGPFVTRAAAHVELERGPYAKLGTPEVVEESALLPNYKGREHLHHVIALAQVSRGEDIPAHWWDD